MTENQRRTQVRPAGPIKPRASTLRRLGKSPRILALAAVGLFLIIGSLALRLLDRPTDPPANNSPQHIVADSFSVGIDKGGFTNLRCDLLCPMSIVFETAGDKDINVTVVGTLSGRQVNGKEPARVVILAPQATDSFALSSSGQETTLRLGEFPVPKEFPGAGPPRHAVMAAIIIKSFGSDGIVDFVLRFRWHAQEALSSSGIGRRNLDISYFPSNPVFVDAGALPIYLPERVGPSLSHVNLVFDVNKKHQIASAVPDPMHPYPGEVVWTSPNDGKSLHYVVTTENKSTRFWVGIFTEQILLLAGLLLGAVIGAMASEWLAKGSS